MPEQELELTLTWENKKLFKMTSKREGQAPKIVVVSAEENGHLTILWEYLQQACERYVKAELDKIGKEMKEP